MTARACRELSAHRSDPAAPHASSSRHRRGRPCGVDAGAHLVVPGASRREVKPVEAGIAGQSLGKRDLPERAPPREPGWSGNEVRSWVAMTFDRARRSAAHAFSMHKKSYDARPEKTDGTVGSTRPRMQDVATTTSVLATGNLPSVGTMPVDGRSPGSQVLVLERTVGFSSPSRVCDNTKERTIRRERGVLPRLIVLPPQWLFRSAAFDWPAAPCDPSPP